MSTGEQNIGAKMKLTIIGSGDAFGSGGRLQTCFHVAHGEQSFLIDCGATALIGFHGLGLEPDDIGTIFISHLHGDHFAGLVWWLLHARFVSRRSKPLDIVGPKGTPERYKAAAEALFPGATEKALQHPLTWHEFEDRVPLAVNGIIATPYPVRHPSGATSYALRIEAGGRVIGFSGDTEWVEGLVEVATGADVYISECYGFDQPTRSHMHWRVIEENLDRLGAQRIVLTHMSHETLKRVSEIDAARVIVAEDGMVLDL